MNLSHMKVGSMGKILKKFCLNQDNPSIDKHQKPISGPKCRNTFWPIYKCSSAVLVLINFADANESVLQ